MELLHDAAALRRRLTWTTLIAVGLGTAGQAQTVNSIGRVKTVAPAAPARAICDAARDARARNSPAAPNLEAQCAAQPVTSIGRVAAPPEPRARATRPDAVIVGREQPDAVTADRVPTQLAYVPDVVGMTLADASRALSAAGYGMQVSYGDEPDAGIGYGRIAATMPEAGRQQSGGNVELVIPRAASLVGSGSLSLKDLERRDGFDLDTLRYEQITRGADIVLAERKSRPAIEPSNGSTYSVGGGIYIEPSDGSAIAFLDERLSVTGGLGAYPNYVACQKVLRATGSGGIEVGDRLANTGVRSSEIAACVRTSKGQIAILTLNAAENPGGTTDFKFRAALFPRQIRTTSDRISETARPR